METFRWGVGCPCRGGRPLKKGAGGGLGGRAKRLPPRCIRRTCYVICLRFVEFWGLVFTICCWFTEMFIKDFGPLVAYLLGGLRLFGALGSYSFWGLLGSLKTWCCVHKTCRFLKVRNFFGPEVLFFLVSCV